MKKKYKSTLCPHIEVSCGQCDGRIFVYKGTVYQLCKVCSFELDQLAIQFDDIDKALLQILTLDKL